MLKNFANRLFQESISLQQVIGSYLTEQGISFDDAIVRPLAEGGDRKLTPAQMENSPRRVFQRLEAADPEHHNVERLFEHVWLKYGDDGELWEALAWDAVLVNLIGVCIEQFGFNPPNTPPLLAGNEVAGCLVPGDRVLNLNYDTLFDLALQQAGRFVVYAPESARGAIVVHKPHGSLNFYADRTTGSAFFADPAQIRGSVVLRDPLGRLWSPAAAIVPPRLGKSYAQHPAAVRILSSMRTFSPELVTFWGVGLTASDVDLLEVYRFACRRAGSVEFINPDPNAHEHAQRVLGLSTQHYARLSDWIAAAHVP